MKILVEDTMLAVLTWNLYFFLETSVLNDFISNGCVEIETKMFINESSSRF